MSSDGWASAAKGGKPLTVLIIGGSLAGLLHGTMIKRLGHNVRILEQNLVSMRTDHAAGMGTGPQGHELLQMLDSYKEPYSIPCPGFQFINRESNVTRLVNTPMNLSGWNVLYYHLRANFDGFESDCCREPPTAMDADGHATYELGKKATNVSYADNKVTVEFDDLIDGGTGSAQSDLVIVADGANSTVRQKLLPSLKHKYSGYVAWRGTVPEKDVSEDTVKLVEKRFTVYPMKQEYILGYVMPGGEGSLQAGDRLLNWVWYFNCPEGSQDLEDNMTDVDGHRHRNTLPVGKMRPEVWAKQKVHAAEVLEPSFLELINKTTEPFISTVRDCASPRATFFHGRLLLVGEALTLMRPHTGMSFSHAAVNCLLLQKVLRGEIPMAEWEREVLTYAEKTRLQSTVLGEYFQSGVLSRNFLLGLISWVFALVRQQLVKVFRRVHL